MTDLSGIRLPNDDAHDGDEDTEMFATVTEMLGDGRVRLQCADGETRIGRIPGRMRKRVWIRKDDLVIIEPWDWQDEKADIKHRYEEDEARQIRESDEVDI